MKGLTYPQAVAATHADNAQRVEWAKHSLSIYRRGGMRKWTPAVTVRQAEQAQQQYDGYLARGKAAAKKAQKRAAKAAAERRERLLLQKQSYERAEQDAAISVR